MTGDPAHDGAALERVAPGTVTDALRVVPGVMRLRAALLALQADGRVEWRDNGYLIWSLPCPEHNKPRPCRLCRQARREERHAR